MNARLLCAASIVACGWLITNLAYGQESDCWTRARDDDGHTYQIFNTIGMWTDESGTEDIGGYYEQQLVGAAFATWAYQFWEGDQASRIIQLGAAYSPDPPWPPDPEDSINWVYWTNADDWLIHYPEGCRARAATEVRTDGGVLLKCDIVLRDLYVLWGDGGGYTLDVQSVMTHELGHCLGLGDLYDNEYICGGQTMWHSIELGDTSQRTLELGDEWGFYRLYGGPVSISYFRAVPESAQVRLEWWSDDGTDSGTIYRGGSCWGPFDWLAPFSSNSGENHQDDRTVEYSREYYYLMVTDEGQRNEAHASPLGLPLYELPDPPSYLVAQDVVGDCGGVNSLSWSSSPDPDALGYHVYRTNPYMPVSCDTDVRDYYLGSTFAPEFIDSTAVLGLTYRYFVAAYDSTGAVSDTTNSSVSGSERDLPVVVYADSCSVEVTIVDSLGLCPLGDMGELAISVTVRDQCGWPVCSLPAEEVFAVTDNSAGGPVSCLNDTIYASSPTNGNGETMIEISRIGGCGDIDFDVYAGGVLLDQSAVFVTSPDLNGDCVVDSADSLLFDQFVGSSDPCADLDGSDYVDQADQVMFSQHYGNGKYHFCADPGYSSTDLVPSSSCIVLCPKGDFEDFAIAITARNALNDVFEHSSIPGDSILAWLPAPGGSGPNAVFRLVCSPQPDTALADGNTDAEETATISVNSGGGHSQSLPIHTEIGRVNVGTWSGDIKSPDIDASGQVGPSDMAVFGADYGTSRFRSDLDCSGQVGDSDFDVLNAHYKHKCGASSQMLAEGNAGNSLWSEQDVASLRSHLANEALNRWLEKQLHPELRALLEEVRSLAEPDSLAKEGGAMESSEMSMLPRVTAVAQSFPNPFRVTAVINYQVAAPGGPVSIFIFDAAGRRVRTLVDKETPPGFYAIPWDGRNDSGRQVASGVYFYQMKAPSFTSNKRMILVR